MATAPAAALHSPCAARALALAPAGATSFQRTSVKISQTRVWPSHVSGRRPLVSADYSDRRGGGAGDFVAGFLLGGAVFGALGYILAPQISKTLEDGDGVKDEGAAAKRPARFLEDDEGLEKTRQTLNEKIAQLNAAIDDVSAQLRTEDGLGNPSNHSVELESAA
jgi:gas vesicle protein